MVNSGVSALEARWRSRVGGRSGGESSATADLSNTLSLLDSTIVAIDSAMAPSSSVSKYVTHRRADLNPADSRRRPDVISPNSGLRLSEMFPWRYDTGLTTATSGSVSGSWRGQAWSRRTQMDKLLPTDNVQFDARQPGIL